MPTPKRINRCPIVDCTFEIKFESTIPAGAVFGFLYQQFVADYPKLEDLPILQIPEAIRERETNLKFSPHYRISNERFSIQIGPNVLTISPILANKGYEGWTIIGDEIVKVFDKLKATLIVKKFLRLGMRYVNFFENLDIFNVINIGLNPENLLINNNSLLRIESIHDEVVVKALQISNNANFQPPKGTIHKGSIIDIDVSIQNNLTEHFEDVHKVCNKIHDIEKEYFFSILKEEFKETLEPIY
jgi:uncharacterized protein (TIGR04255 family)